MQGCPQGLRLRGTEGTVAKHQPGSQEVQPPGPALPLLVIILTSQHMCTRGCQTLSPHPHHRPWEVAVTTLLSQIRKRAQVKATQLGAD